MCNNSTIDTLYNSQVYTLVLHIRTTNGTTCHGSNEDNYLVSNAGACIFYARLYHKSRAYVSHVIK